MDSFFLCNDLVGVRIYNIGWLFGKDDLVMFVVLEFGKIFSILEEEKKS